MASDQQLEQIARIAEDLLLQNIKSEPGNSVTVDKGFIIASIEMIKVLREERDALAAQLGQKKRSETLETLFS